MNPVIDAVKLLLNIFDDFRNTIIKENITKKAVKYITKILNVITEFILSKNCY